jgi:hypothetical protein
VGEVLMARGYYEQRYRTSFSLAIVTNQTFTTSAMARANESGVRSVDRAEICRLLASNPLQIAEVMAMEQNRLRNLE